MRFIPTLAHGFADYIVGLTVIALAFMADADSAARWTLVALGAAALLYSLITDYELGVVRFLRIRFHLFLDALFGVAMLALPWVTTLPAQLVWPTATIGILALLLAAATKVQAVGTAANA